MQTKRDFSDDIFIQKQSFILDSIKQNRNRVLFFLAFVLYVLLTVLGTTDRDFFFESGISFPLLNIKLPLIAFYVVVPIIIILIHFNVLYLYQEHQKLLQKHATLENFYSSMPLGIFDMPIITKGTIHTLIKIFTYLVIYIMPLLTLYILWWHFNKYQSSFYSNLHLLYIALDTLLLSYFLIATKVGKILSALLWVGFTIVTILQMAINNEEKIQNDAVKKYIKKYYPHLELSGEYLVNFDYEQLKSLQSLEKLKSLALLQPPLILENRSFKYGNFSYSLLIRTNLKRANLKRANLSYSNLQGANLSFANLQYSHLYVTNLKGANLTFANLQNSRFIVANLQGVDLEHAKLQNSKLIVSNLQGANLVDSNFQGASLNGSKLQGSDLWFANFQGARLYHTNFQGAYLVDTNLQGTYSCIIQDNDSFAKKINHQISKYTNLNCIDIKTFTKKEKEHLIKSLQLVNKNYQKIVMKKHILSVIERIQKSTSAMPDLSKAKTGSYTKEEAQKWIEDYKKAMGEKQ